MSQHDFLSFIVRMIPEAFLMIYAVCKLTNTNINLKRIFVSCILGGVGVYIARLLPVHFGVHTIISVMIYIVLAIRINKIDMFKAIATTLAVIIVLFISDFTFVVIYTNVLHLSSELLFGQSWIAVVSGIPSLILFYLIVNFIVLIKKNRKIKNEQC